MSLPVVLFWLALSLSVACRGLAKGGMPQACILASLLRSAGKLVTLHQLAVVVLLLTT